MIVSGDDVGTGDERAAAELLAHRRLVRLRATPAIGPAGGDRRVIHIAVQDSRNQRVVSRGADGTETVGRAAIGRNVARVWIRAGVKAERELRRTCKEVRKFEDRIPVGRTVVRRPVLRIVPEGPPIRGGQY